MQEIQENIYRIREVIEDTKDYAQKMLYFKAEGDSGKMRKYAELTEGGLREAKILREILLGDICRSKPSPQEQELFEVTDVEYAEKITVIRKTLSNTVKRSFTFRLQSK